MSPEEIPEEKADSGEAPAGGTPGDASDQELKKILGDEYDAVVGAAGSADRASGAAAAETSVGLESGAFPSGDGVDARADATEPADDPMEDVPIGVPEADGPGAPPAGSGPADPASPRSEAKAHPIQFGQLEDAGPQGKGGIEVLLDVELPISVELGRTKMLVKEILECGPGTVVELDKLAGEPVDVFINGRMVAQGEVVVVDEHFGVRVTNLLSPRDRVKSLA